MKSLMLGIAAAGLLTSGIGLAQTTQGTAPADTGPTTTAPRPATGPAVAPAGTTGAAVDRNKNTAAASGDTNQAVATTSANAPVPAKGANSFTMGEAKSRIESTGFTNVSNLGKDGDGIWRGSAQKAGSSTQVWLDYKGNVGSGK
jgi:hypothetical protein